jgi:iron complex outermembrane recepter protein
MRTLFFCFMIHFFFIGTIVSASGIRGVVTDDEGNPLDSVSITESGTGLSIYSNKDGFFSFDRAEKGECEITFSKPDYITLRISLRPGVNDTSVTVSLQSALQELEQMTVVATAAPSRRDEISRTVSVRTEKELQQTHAQSLGDALGTMPGVQLASQGPNVTKPVIRGMTNQRIVLVRDGARHEAQQWSNHHTPEVDIADASKIEVLRGPGSLLYGSGALGGVVLVRSPRILTTGDGAKPLGSDVSYQFFTNSQQHAGHLGVHGAWSWGAWRADISGRDAPWFAVPGKNHFLVKQAAGEVSDSVPTEFAGFREYNVRLMAGISKENYELTLTGTHYREEQKLIGEGHWHNSGGPDGGPWYHVGEPILSPTLHQKVQLNSKFFTGNHTFTFDIAGQHDHRQGIPGSIGVQVDLENYYATADGRWNHCFNNKIPGTIGVSVSRKQDRTDGVEVLIPDYNTTDAGVFIFQEVHPTDRFNASIGVRGDFRDYRIFRTQMTEGFRPYLPATLRGITVDSIPSLYVKGGDLMAAPSFSTGFSWKPLPVPISLAANLGSGFRLPEPNELAILGAHHGSYEYLVGLAVTDPEKTSITIDEIGRFRETAYNADLILRSSYRSFSAECALYYNRLVDYIHAKPTGEFVWLSAISALPVKEYVQTDACIYGLELSGSQRLLSWLSLRSGFDITTGKILDEVTDSDGDGVVEPWLPGISPPRLTGGITLEWPSLSLTWLQRGTFDFEAEGYFAQKRLAEFENVLRKDSDGNNVLFPAKGYVLFNAGINVDVKLFSKVLLVSLKAKNLLNTEYTSHLSNYKGIAKNPGFDFSVIVSAEL